MGRPPHYIRPLPLRRQKAPEPKLYNPPERPNSNHSSLIQRLRNGARVYYQRNGTNMHTEIYVTRDKNKTTDCRKDDGGQNWME